MQSEDEKMTTQKRTVRSTAAAALVGALIVCAFALVVTGLGSVTNCVAITGSASEAASTTDDTAYASSSTAVANADVEHHDIVDSVGRTVSIPVNPQHIATMDSFSGNVCVLVGAGSQLMGTPGGVLSNELLKQIYPDLENVQQLSGNGVNVETLLSAGVDVAIVKGSLYAQSDEMAKLDTLGIPYVVVDYDTVEQQISAIEMIGEVCGGEGQVTASRIASYYQSTVEDVEARAAGVPAEERVKVYHAINGPLLTDGSDSIGADWITRTGAIDVSATEDSNGGAGDYTATLEQVYAWNPDVIVCSSAADRVSILADIQWQGIDAVSRGDVLQLPVSTSRWGQRGDPETFLAMIWLGSTLYPEQYADVDVKQTVIDYYQDIIGLTIDDATYEQILSGEGLRVQGTGNQGEK